MRTFVLSLGDITSLTGEHLDALLSDALYLIVELAGHASLEQGAGPRAATDTRSASERFEDAVGALVAALTQAPTQALAMRMEQIIESRYAEPLNVKVIASSVGRSAGHAEFIFRNRTGMTLQAYLATTRMRKAAELIRRGEKIESVAGQVGYRSRSAFNAAFRRALGCPPSAFQPGRIVTLPVFRSKSGTHS